MDWNFPYASSRMPVLARNCVATTQPLAAQAGLTMLAKGGTAVDAALATAIALTVVEPTMNGIGGDAFAIVHDGKALYGLNASGRAPKAWHRKRFDGHDKMPVTGWDSVTVPGGVAGWAALHERFGRLPFEALFEPAIRYAKEGFLVSPVIAQIWQNQVERLRDQPGFAESFLPHGRAPTAGEVFRCPGQTDTLELIARSKGEEFYRGSLAQKIAAAAKAQGGALSLSDLADHAPDWVAPISVGFAGYDIHELPPNGQGISALIALGILDRLDIDGLDADSPEFVHLQIEATKIGMAEVRAHVGDPSAMRLTSADLLDPARLDAHAARVTRDRVSAPAPARQSTHGTVYLAAADHNGMAVSFIQSNYRGFGSGVVVPGTGIALHNRGCCFVLDKDHPNIVGPGKRPLNTIIPGFATKNGKTVAALGVMGGSMQPQGHVQVACRMLARNQNPQAVIDAPRWRFEDGQLSLEAAWPEATRSALAAFGHTTTGGTYLDFGAAQIICRLGEDGWIAASEGRRDGCAVGL
ncbi:gamma-glutamyltransferase family protein [Nordella sp. HKS 07]|uniref:gamma-glutamyltransferase family protein n=1 Tax=Nordella sp. HKS 07 TaxID=2712222 RepID=UPI0019D16C3B|nr:gamma-glutamyltransferase family protein [Nordella sp. HKS 07]